MIKLPLRIIRYFFIIAALAILSIQYIGFKIPYEIKSSVIQKEKEFAYVYIIDNKSSYFSIEGDSAKGQGLDAQLSESNKLLGPGHQLHDDIRKKGNGRYSLWGDYLYFSASDNSDPRVNNKQYILKAPAQLSKEVIYITIFALVLFLLPTIYKAIRNLLKNGKQILLPIISYAFIISLAWYLFRYCSYILLWLNVILFSFGCAGLLVTMIRSYSSAKPDNYNYKNHVYGLFVIILSLSTAAMITESFLWYKEKYSGISPNALRIISSNQDATKYDAIETHKNNNINTSETRNDLFPSDIDIEKKRSLIKELKNIKLPEDYFTKSLFTLPDKIILEADRRKSLLTLPKEWEFQQVQVKGYEYSYRWHGHLFKQNHDGFRDVIKFKRKDPNIFRVIVVGDSLTYALGVESKWGYVSQLNEYLKGKYNIEFLNLGVNGDQSEDVYMVLKQYLHKLKPDLVIYGIVVNDFLPSKAGQYSGDQYSLPLPENLKKYFINRSRFIQFLNTNYDASLRRLHLRRDFIDDILIDFKGYRKRFTRDLAMINSYVKNNNLPPVIAIALNQFPTTNGRLAKIISIIESTAREVGMNVIDTGEFAKTYDGLKLSVSRWEGHPNEIAHNIYANMIALYLISNGYLNGHEKK